MAIRLLCADVSNQQLPCAGGLRQGLRKPLDGAATRCAHIPPTAKREGTALRVSPSLIPGLLQELAEHRFDAALLACAKGGHDPLQFAESLMFTRLGVAR